MKKWLKRVRIVPEKNIMVINLFFKKMKFKFLGNNIRISPGSKFFRTENITIKNDVFISTECYFEAVSDIIINSGCMIGPRVICIAGTHKYDDFDLKSIPYDNRIVDTPIIIGENVWIGANVTICPGTVIGEGAIIGMGSIIAGEIEPYAVVISQKARTIKYRNIEHYDKLKKEELIYNNIFAGTDFKLD